MKYLKKYNEGLEEFFFPNAEKAIETIDFYIKQYEDDGFPIERIPGWGPEWSRAMRDTENKIKYYFRTFPNDIPPSNNIKSFKSPRIDCLLTSKVKNLDLMRKLYNQMRNIPKALLQDDDLYAHLSINEADEIPGDEDIFINLTIFTNQEDLDYKSERSNLSKNWKEAKKRQNSSK